MTIKDINHDINGTRLDGLSHRLLRTGITKDSARIGQHLNTVRILRHGGWIPWIASVILCSASFTALLHSKFIAFHWNKTEEKANEYYNSDYVGPSVSASGPEKMVSSISRRATCQSGGSQIAEYNQALRIGAVFIILAVSSLACAVPLMAQRLPGLKDKMSSKFFFAVKHFGTGVLIATAFVHLLPTAFTLLGDPCLSRFWTEDYPAMPGAIALAGIFIVTFAEMLLHPARGTPQEPPLAGHESIGADRPCRGKLGSIRHSLSGNGNRGQDEKSVTAVGKGKTPTNGDVERGGWAGGEATLTPEQKHKKEIMHCFLLEMGILFHSVFIGMALSVSISGNEFVVLLVAISFHQTFEGLALGARIADIDWPEKSLQPIYMAVAYGCTTPIGQAIGLAARSAYSPDSEVGLILVGVMNAISAGLLVFASLVELLSEDLLTDESWRTLRGRNRVYACMLVVAGAFGMSLVGAWA
ncbi:ZIP zinc transporter-domain-containing protein [Hypoxylon crocopeplum]|nr:ZIP zinc transporter-domain-containing protein [Hypoxylon crocopeplum]